MKSSFPCGAFLLICTMAFPMQANAAHVLDYPKGQTPDSTLQEAVVVATRAEESTPIAFTNLDKDAIEMVNTGRDIPFLLSTLPSVTVASDAGAGIGYTYLKIRGTDPTRINITANGIPLNDAESNAIYWVNMGDFASSLNSIQVQRGVGTSTIGSGAFGASVSMQTETISPKPYFQLDLSGGSYATHKETARFSTGLLGGHWGFSGRLSNIGTDGYIDRASARLNSYFLQGGYFSDKTIVKFITFNGTERTYLSWDYASREDMEKYGRTYNPSGKYKDNDGNTQFYKDQIDDYHQQHYQLHWTQNFLPELTMNLSLHYTKGLGYYETYKKDRTLYEYAIQPLPSQEYSDLVRRKYSSADFFGTVFNLRYKKNGLDAVIGGGWNEYKGKHYGKVVWVRSYEGSLPPENEYYRNKSDKKDFNIFARASYQFLRGLTGYVDLQYRYVDYDIDGPSDEWYGPGDPVKFNFHNNFSFFNPKAGLFYRITPNHTVFFSYGMGHKEPTRNDYEAVLWTTSVPRSETLNDFELGYNLKLKKFSLGVNFYYMHYKDQFVMTGEQDQNGEFVTKNVGKSYRRGVELTAAWTPIRFFRWDANLTWSRNRIKDYTVVLDDTGEAYNMGDTPISYSPSLIFNNIFSAHWKGLDVSLHTQYVGRQYMTNTGLKSFEQDGKQISTMLKAFCTTNLNLSYTFDFIPRVKSLTIGATVYNMFGMKYEANGSAYACLKSDGKGGVMGYQNSDWDSYAAFSAQAPAHFIVRASVRF